MILIGNGALLKKALLYSLEKGHAVDLVLSHTGELKEFCKENKISFKETDNVNADADVIRSHSSDKIVFSINNGQIISEELINLPGFKFYNIHNGILPDYRGTPEVCIMFAILNGEENYGVSLHQMDKEIDKGACIDILKFPISGNDNFQSVMLNSLEHCHTLFCRHLDAIQNNRVDYLGYDEKKNSRLYSYKDLRTLRQYKNEASFKRATSLGIFKLWFTDAHNIIQEINNAV